MMEIKAPDNPFYAYVDFDIDGHNLSSVPPSHIESFNYERVTSDKSNKVMLTIHDESAIIIESWLMESAKSGSIPCSWKYGYTNGTSSPKYSGMITEYDLDFTTTGVTINIEGISSGLSSFGTPVTKSWDDMDIHEIVESIAKEEGWEVKKVEPCEPIYSETDEEGTQTKMKFICSNLPVVKFIEQELKPLARKLGTGEADFKFYFDDSGDKPKVVFAPPSYTDEINSDTAKFYEFAWGTDDVNSPVISFNPSYSGIVTAFNGASNVTTTAVDKLKNQMFTVKFNGGDSDKYTQVVGGSSYSLDQAKSIAAKMWYTQANQSYPAELVIVGDPTIEPMSMISILVLNYNGLPHHSSGAYTVTQVVDDITGGDYTTTLSLIRNPLTVSETDRGISISLQGADSVAIANPSVGGESSQNTPTTSERRYINLSPTVSSWRVYDVNGPYTVGNEIYRLNPMMYGGLSYDLLEEKGNNVYIIPSEKFGKMAIYLPPGDDTGTINSTALYKDGNFNN